MKKLLTLSLTVLLAITACFSLVGCGDPETPDNPPTQTEVTFVGTNEQVAALQNVFIGDADFAVVDKLLATYHCRPAGQFAGLAILSTNEYDLKNEVSYGFAVKAGSGIDVVLNAALYELQQTGVLATVAVRCGFEPSVLCNIAAPEVKFADVQSGAYTSEAWSQIVKKGYVQLGYVRSEDWQNDPILQRSQYGSVDGLELQIFVEIYKLFGMNVKKQNNAANKLEMLADDQATDLTGLDLVNELNNGNVDVLVNRVLSTTTGVDMTSAYIKDKQVVVVKAENADKNLEFFKTKKFTAKTGSIGETLIKGQINDTLFAK